MPPKLRFLTDYLQFRLRAKNRHGLHSPFVYTLLDDVIYNFTPQPQYPALQAASQKLPSNSNIGNSPKVNHLLFRLVQHFHPQTIFIGSSVSNISAAYVKAAAPDAVQLKGDTANPIDLMLTDASLPGINFQAFNPQSVIIVTNIYKSEVAKANWQLIRQNGAVTVTIDLFWLGLVFFRAGQAHEHFKLRF